MTNKIDNMTQQYLQISGRPAQASPSEKASEGAAVTHKPNSVATTDTVELTHDARLMQAMEERIGQLGEVDQSRVDAVRSRIESGDYQVSSERIADKMIAMDRSLPGDS